MTKDKPRNMAASVRQRLMNKAREGNEDLGIVLTRYGLERFLYRLSQSAHREQFILKGAMLFQLWSGQLHRPTRDLDLLGFGDPAPDRFQRIISDICQQEVNDDGLVFQADSIQAERMKADEEYQGLRVKLQAMLGSARITIQIDVGFGDAIHRVPDEISYPTLLDLPAPILKAYPRETVVAEKFQAMVMLGIANSRMKDFYDIWTLAQKFEFSGPVLCSANRATFERRKTVLPAQPPLALTSEFAGDRQKRSQWHAFARKGKLETQGMELSTIATDLRLFLMPPTESIVADEDFEMNWLPSGPWVQKTDG